MAPESIKEETAKQASTTDQMDKVREELSEEQKVEEEDDRGSDIDRKYEYVPELEQEWDMDSYDGREVESGPKFRQLFSNEENCQRYCSHMREDLAGKGFIPVPFFGINPIDDLDEIGDDNMTLRERMTIFANSCVKKLNEEKGTTLELVEIVRAIRLVQANWKYYITFMAREYLNGPLVEYQAKVMNFRGNEKSYFPNLCRPSPGRFLYPL